MRQAQLSFVGKQIADRDTALAEYEKRTPVVFGLARSSDPVTSHEAAAKVQKRTVNHKRVLELLVAHGPMTDLELLGRWHDSYGEVPESTPRKRRCDLVRMGLVEAQQDADGQAVKRRLNGSRRLVWSLKP